MLKEQALLDRVLMVERMEHNMQQKLKYVAQSHPLMSFDVLGDTQVVDSSLPSDTFNTAYGGLITAEIAQNVFDYYKEKNYPMAWWVGPNSQKEFTNNNLMSAGFTHQEYDVGMQASLLQIPNYNIATDLIIKRCETASDFKDFGYVLSSIFAPYPEEQQVKRYYELVPLMEQKQLQDLHLFVGYIGNKPVSTSGLFVTDCVGIFDISTKPEERKKGYGTALFYHALIQARSLGYEVAVLQASPDGLGIYEKFGFTRNADFNVWSNVNALQN